MVEILEKIYSILRHALPFSFALAFIGIVLILLSNVIESLKKNPKKLRSLGIAFVSQLFLLGLVLVAIQTTVITKIRNEFITIVKDPNSQIIQKDHTFGKFTSAEIKDELLKIKGSEPHHSGTGREMKLEILTNGKKFNITLAQDEQNKKEFWIFFDKYKFGSSSEEIGKIKSQKFK